MYVRGDDAGRVSPFATSIGRIAALTKDKNAAVALNDVNGGGRIDDFFLNFALIRSPAGDWPPREAVGRQLRQVPYSASS